MICRLDFINRFSSPFSHFLSSVSVVQMIVDVLFAFLVSDNYPYKMGEIYCLGNCSSRRNKRPVFLCCGVVIRKIREGV